MGHDITALVVAEPFDEAAAREWDVEGLPLGHGLRLVHISPAYASYQQRLRRVGALLDVPDDLPSIFPREAVLADLAASVTGRDPASFAVIMTDYFGGVGDQWACAFLDGARVPSVENINGALRALGVRPDAGLDEFDTVGLSRHHRTPDALDRYDLLD
ncbi:hypothetical protein GCM10010112_89130 [Actinoplanes lobatus]|uniref:Uncharacterized protein n=1 Tax=Actinoplanes lobatus TaxID=113568 RepID=A0A7W7MKP5_9ACTN|nr:hypothetical protein [Actinoplanes lobatus]MBB4753904.1 hypothetical protein [Actinoplanes lobatus]GGN97175.1 hypothetical protein GCM10010112_89130 [Actinoplanes lobatus]GIE45519.1 hypothetical protein Alo02nite_84170 [Actinoplanes lobatus]